MTPMSADEQTRELSNLIQDAEVAALLDKGVYAGQDNTLMNRQTIIRGVRKLLAAAATNARREDRRWFALNLAEYNNPETRGARRVQLARVLNARLAALDSHPEEASKQ